MELRRVLYILHKLASQLSSRLVSKLRPQMSKRNSGILDIVLGMPDLMATGRK